MTVQELIDRLKTEDPNTVVKVCTSYSGACDIDEINDGCTPDEIYLEGCS